MLTTIVIFAMILVVIVVIHELGHFLVARLFDVYAPEFGIGFPPRMCKLFRWRETQFVLNWLPIGGYVNLAGEGAPGTDGQEIEVDKDIPASRLFSSKSAWQRFLIILAGPAMNLFLAIFLFMWAYGFLGIPVQLNDGVMITDVEADSPADFANLQAGDKIIAVSDATGDESLVFDMNEFIVYVNAHRGQAISLQTVNDCHELVCDGEPNWHTVVIRTLEETPAGSGSLGVVLSSTVDVFYPWYQHIPLSVYYGAKQSLYFAKSILGGLAQGVANLFRPQESELVLMGPIGMVSELNQPKTFSRGILEILSFAGLLSVNLAVVNLLPIPAVDGGRLVLILLEKLVGRARIAKIEYSLNYVGLVFLFGLMLVITGKDVWRLLWRN